MTTQADSPVGCESRLTPTAAAVRSGVITIDDMLAELRHRGWTLYLWGTPQAPELYTAVRRHPQAVDVLIIRDSDNSVAYRTAITPGDIFQPEFVSYQYYASPEWALRAILTLPDPGEWGSPQRVEKVRHRSACFIDRNAFPPPIKLTVRPLRG